MSISNITTTIKNINLDQDCCARCKGKFEDEESKKIVPFDDDDNFYCRRCVQFVFEEWQEKHRDEEEEEDGMEDCDDCGYTHHYEDKCPIGEQCEKYENWREREEGDCVDDAEDEEWKVNCDGCHTMFSPGDLNAIGLSISLCNKCYCQKKLNESYERCAILKAEHKANLKIIKDKVKGKIRAAQSRNKKIREMLKDEEYGRDAWNNGGVW